MLNVIIIAKRCNLIIKKGKSKSTIVYGHSLWGLTIGSHAMDYNYLNITPIKLFLVKAIGHRLE